MGMSNAFQLADLPADFPDDGYTPTPEEIARECEAIRQEWSEAEHRKRAGLKSYSWKVPVLRLDAVCCEM